MAKKPFVIAIPVYDGVDPLDVSAPFEVFQNMGDVWRDRPVEVHLVAKTRRLVATRFGMQIKPGRRYDQVTSVDLFWVPGGAIEQLHGMMQDTEVHEILRKWSRHAKYVTSVCEGALILASAGLLNGCRATTHWAFLPCLRQFKGVEVVGGHGFYPRWIVDDRATGDAIRVTGAGISAGLDESLKIVELICGDDLAKQVQVSIQYFPEPPVCGEITDAKGCPPGVFAPPADA